MAKYKMFYLRRKPGFVVRKVGDARMIVPVGPRMKDYKGVITINETSAFLFELFKEEHDNEFFVEALMKEYPEIDHDTAMSALSAFAYQCQAAGLLEEEETDTLPEQFIAPPDFFEKLKEEEEAEKAAAQEGNAQETANPDEGGKKA